jgi:ankyrin repeat protein
MTKFILKHGVDVNARNGLTETPLHLAAGAYFKGEKNFIKNMEFFISCISV